MNTEGIQDSPALKEKYVCPWRIVPLIDNILRPLVHNPQKLFGPYVRPGMTVLDVGCGRGFASLGLARLVGESGLVISADLQPEMLDMVRERAEKAGLQGRMRFHRCEATRIGISDELDFAVALFMVHEVPDSRAFLGEIFSLLRPGGMLFLAEPRIHVSPGDFRRTVTQAEAAGFEVAARPAIRIGRAVVLTRPADEIPVQQT